MERANLKDIAFLIITKFDSIARLENALAVTQFLTKNFETNVYLWEFASHYNGFVETLMPSEVNYKFYQDFDPILHRTRFLNEMVLSISEKFVSIWDADVIVPVNQIVTAVKKLRDGADVVYPYNKFFCDTKILMRDGCLVASG